jgi:hypothetical protein
MFPLHMTRIAFPSPLTPYQRDLVLQAKQGWGDPEQLTDSEAAELKVLCGRWFGVPSDNLQARVWLDAVVFTAKDKPNIEYAIIVTRADDDQEQIVLYNVNRGHRLIPAEHCSIQYLYNVICMAIDESGIL